MSHVLKDISERIALLTINRPEALNAANQEVVVDLETAVQDCINDSNVGVIILTGAGEKAFVAGADIKQMQSMDSGQALTFGTAGQKMTCTIENSPKPVIAAVNGFALGGGCEISLACHIRIASENARFSLPEVSLGLLPGWGGTQRLPRLIGAGRAIEMIATGGMVSAAEALRMGLVNHVVPLTGLLDKAREIGQNILRNGPNAIAYALTCVLEGRNLSIKEGLDMEAQRFSALFDTAEATEGLTAFVEKRKAKFR